MKLETVTVMTSMLVLAGILTWAFTIQPIKANPETIYIKADGSVDPATANITTTNNFTYTFTDNINESIIIQRTNITIDGAGYMLQGTGSGTGIDIWISGFQANITIKNMEIVSFTTGIWLSNAANVTVSESEIRDCYGGIAFGESWDNVISGNIITNNTNGIGGNTVMDTVFSGNIITNNTNGILLSYAQNNSIYLNNVTNNEYGIYMEGMYVYNNTFYHNNFINNTNQVFIEQTNPNVWDDGYPSGGNYWHDFPDLYPLVGDDNSGPGQNETGSDGIWDGPYGIDGNNTDRYPLTTVIPEFPEWTLIVPAFVVLTVAMIIYKRRLIKTPIR